MPVTPSNNFNHYYQQLTFLRHVMQKVIWSQKNVMGPPDRIMMFYIDKHSGTLNDFPKEPQWVGNKAGTDTHILWFLPQVPLYTYTPSTKEEHN